MLNRLIAGPLSQSEIQATIDKLVARILMHSAPSQIILFGSAARGEAREGSDIDLAIVYPTAKEIPAAKIAILRQKPVSDLPVDLLFLDEHSYHQKKKIGGVSMIIADEGVQLYCRG